MLILVDLHIPGGSLHHFQRGIDHAPHKPRFERTRRIETVDRADQFDKGILHDFFGQAGIARDEIGCAHSLHLMTCDEYLQTADVTVLKSLNCLLFVHIVPCTIYPHWVQKVGW